MSPLRGVRKGNNFAGKVADYTGTERRVLNGSQDCGDLISGEWNHEVKCPGRGQPVKLSEAMTQSKRSATNRGVHKYSVITRRTGYPISEAIFSIPLWLAVELGLDPIWDGPHDAG